MFEVTTTGVNECYGKKGEKRLLCDNYLTSALRSGWITEKIKYVGSGKTSKAEPITVQEKLMPIKRIDAIRTLQAQKLNLDRIKDKIDSMIAVNERLMKMIKDDDK